MKKKIVSLVISVCLISSLCLVQPVFAGTNEKENKNVDYDIDRVYADAYTEAISNNPIIIDSDESAYSYILEYSAFSEPLSPLARATHSA